MSRLLTRTEASEYLREKYGAPAARTPKTLAKLHWAGTGPVAVRVGSRIGYSQSALDEWVLGKSLSVTSTSDPGRGLV